MRTLPLKMPMPEIEIFCRRHHIRKLSLFGSILGNDFNDESDVDMLVEFDAAHIPGLAFFDMRDELSPLVGRRVDLNTPASLSRYFRNAVLQSAETIYAG